MTLPNINLSEYNYDLPHDRIAQHPASQRDLSKLLVYDGKTISQSVFRNIADYIPSGSLLVFNNTRVIRARLLFRKETGAIIEILCLEPLKPEDYDSSFGSTGPLEWKCMIGNLKKWKKGKIRCSFRIKDIEHFLSAERICSEGDAWRVRFEWDAPGQDFAGIIELTGQLPLPPYVDREAEDEDLERYQTIYSARPGSVAAPTAGLHFTENTLGQLNNSGVYTAEITLHVGAGTFKPIKSASIAEHEMHCEHFILTRETVEQLRNFSGAIIAVGTTSVRTLESLYWLGSALNDQPAGASPELILGQWDAYKNDTDISAMKAMENILNYMNENKINSLNAATSMMIVPGYRFRMISGMVTNFHQPMSTLLLLVSAYIGKKWKELYSYALSNDFRFLSYGDSSVLFENNNELNQKK